MRRIILAALAAIAQSVSLGQEVGYFYSGADSARLIAIEHEADRVLHLDIDDTFDLGIKADEKGSVLRFPFERIAEFLDREPQKRLIVIWFDQPVVGAVGKELPAWIERNLERMHSVGTSEW